MWSMNIANLGVLGIHYTPQWLKKFMSSVFMVLVGIERREINISLHSKDIRLTKSFIYDFQDISLMGTCKLFQNLWKIVSNLYFVKHCELY